MPIIQVCFLASCVVEASDRGAALDNMDDSDVDATFTEEFNQGAKASTQLETGL